ncbi:MAG: NAD(P)/FAD-dependent oxidoreductase [Acidobacteriota bacterium]
MPKVTIIGAGLAGSLLAIYLGRRGFEVDVFEARGDMRREPVAAGRSINLALSDRGIAALREVGMDNYILAEAVPMTGRMIHAVSGETKLLPYSGREGEYINSVSRAGLNIALISEAEKYESVKFYFGRRCENFDITSGEVEFKGGRKYRSNTVIATDGAGSAVRQAMEQQLSNFGSSSVFLEHGYKELHIPAGHSAAASPEFNASAVYPVTTGRGSDLALNALHIWPRHKFMMIALPNLDGSYTCTLFLADKTDLSSDTSEPTFETLSNWPTLKKFFEAEFPDALPLMPDLEFDFFNNPTGQLGTLKCWPWNVDGRVLLLGDSAHAMVPFYGQGMNCAFEDVRVFAALIDRHIGERSVSPEGSVDWQDIYDEYGAHRKKNTDAIAEMAEENFYEMRDATADPVFQRKRRLETLLEQTFPDYFSKYSMVTFREDLPYSVAMTKGNAQDRLLMMLAGAHLDISKLDLEVVMSSVRDIDRTPPASQITT